MCCMCLSQMQVGIINVYFWYPISKRKATTTIIHRLHGNKPGSWIVHVDYLAIWVVEMFIPYVMVPHSEIMKVKKLKDSKGAIGIWSSKFFKACLIQQNTFAHELQAYASVQMIPICAKRLCTFIHCTCS